MQAKDANTELKNNNCDKKNVLDCAENWYIRFQHIQKDSTAQSDWTSKGVNVACGELQIK